MKHDRSKIAGRFQSYPDLTGERRAEGGRRLKGVSRKSTPQEPLVTIITVCWNSAKTIEQAMLSVFAQTYANIEYVIVDGASSDATVDIIRKHEDKVDYFVSEPDKGLYYAMNKGVELASGEFIVMLNSDDWYMPDCIESLLAARQETKADFVSGLANYVDGDGKLLRQQPSFSFDGNVMFMMPLRHETMLVPAAVYNAVGPYDTSYRVIADRVFTTMVYEAGYSHHEIPRPLMCFRDTGVSSVNLDAVRAERKKIISRNFPFLSDEDVTRLSELEQLDPQAFQQMVATYQEPKLSRAAADMVADRRSRGNKKWSVLEPDTLRAIGKPAAPRIGQPNRRLRVATFVTSDHGGAGIGSQRRVEALRKAGVDARIYCLFQNSPYAHVGTMRPNIPGWRDMRRPDIHKVWRGEAVVTHQMEPGLKAREFFSKTGTIVDFTQNREIFDEADVIHLHWTVGMLDYANLGEVIGDKPVVWTPADMNPFTGGCHYSEGCMKFTKDCQRCPLLGGSNLAHECWTEKRDAYAKIRNLNIVSPSVWLAERARKSTLFGDRPIHVIPNAFPVDRFTPTNKFVARSRLGLPFDKKLILFGADNVKNLRKGGDIMIKSIKRLKEMGHAKDVEGVYFGANAVEFDIPSHGMGHITEEEKLSLVYAAADVFASPSREDSGPMTVAESMMSGTPVVAFRIGNAQEIVVHKDTGYIAGQENINDFANGLAWALKDARSPEAILRGLRCHAAARAHNDPDRAAKSHIELYTRLIEESRAQQSGAARALQAS